MFPLWLLLPAAVGTPPAAWRPRFEASSCLKQSYAGSIRTMSVHMAFRVVYALALNRYGPVKASGTLLGNDSIARKILSFQCLL
jgi:hypothetical protein